MTKSSARLSSSQALTKLRGEVAEIAHHLWTKGWAERNAGNISVDVTDLLPGSFKITPDHERIWLSRSYPVLAGRTLLISGTGTRMRDIAIRPCENTCLVRIVETGNAAVVLGDTRGNLKPTSEFPAHLAIHELLAKRKDKRKVVIHTHPDELIAMSHIPQFKSENVLNKRLWAMHPETVIVIPQGIGFVPYKVPGSEELADATVKELAQHKVVLWEKHGVVAIGQTPDDAFDCIDTLAKSAAIFFKCRQAGFEPEGLTQSQIDKLRIVFKGFGD